MTDYRFIYITTGDQAEARKIGEALVRERLVACANILPSIQSYYWWEGEVQSSAEAVLIAKTRQALVEPLIEKVKSLHSYSCPCVVALPIEAGHAPFLRWIEEQTR